jgi:branched-chain amino acid transport system ATP-binding protein
VRSARVAALRDALAPGYTIIWIEHVAPALTAVVARLPALVVAQPSASGGPDEVMRSDAVRDIYLGVD